MFLKKNEIIKNSNICKNNYFPTYIIHALLTRKEKLASSDQMRSNVFKEEAPPKHNDSGGP